MLNVKVAITERPGQTITTKMDNVNIQHASPKCAAAETAVSGGFAHKMVGDLTVMHFQKVPNANAWEIATAFNEGGTLSSVVECLRVGLALK
jgi:hypothetical protein